MHPKNDNHFHPMVKTLLQLNSAYFENYRVVPEVTKKNENADYLIHFHILFEFISEKLKK